MTSTLKEDDDNIDDNDDDARRPSRTPKTSRKVKMCDIMKTGFKKSHQTFSKILHQGHLKSSIQNNK